jgi:hypothetical protein
MSYVHAIPPGPTCQPTEKTLALVKAWLDAEERMHAMEAEHEKAQERAEARAWRADAALADHLKDELGLPSGNSDSETGIVVGDILIYVQSGGVPYQEEKRPRVFYYRIAGRA